MKHTIKNLINSPYDVVTVDGVERIPARGELTAEFDERALVNLRQMGYFEISEADAAAVKIDVDNEAFTARVEQVATPDAEPAKRGPGRPKKAD